MQDRPVGDELVVPALNDLYAEVRDYNERYPQFAGSETGALLKRAEAYLAARVAIEDASRKLIEKGF